MTKWEVKSFEHNNVNKQNLEIRMGQFFLQISLTAQFLSNPTKKQFNEEQWFFSGAWGFANAHQISKTQSRSISC